MFKIVNPDQMALQPVAAQPGTPLVFAPHNADSIQCWVQQDAHFVNVALDLVLETTDDGELTLQSLKRFDSRQKWTLQGDFLVNTHFDKAITVSGS